MGFNYVLNSKQTKRLGEIESWTRTGKRVSKIRDF